MLVISALLLIPPPVPPSPPEALAIAAEIRVKAPFDPVDLSDAENIALGRIATTITSLPFPAVDEARDVLARLWAPARDELRAKAFACVDEVAARGFDTSELRDVRKIVETPAGTRIWHRALSEGLRSCFETTALDWIGGQGIKGALQWASRERRLTAILRYDPAATSLVAYAATLERACGRNARGSLQVKGEKIGFRAGWIEQDLRASRGNAFMCLTSLSKLGGHELVAFSQ